MGSRRVWASLGSRWRRGRRRPRGWRCTASSARVRCCRPATTTWPTPSAAASSSSRRASTSRPRWPIGCGWGCSCSPATWDRSATTRSTARLGLPRLPLAPWLGLRAGRIKLPFGLYNEYSDIDSARLSILLPQSLYPTRSRDFLLAQTGFSLYGSRRPGDLGALDYQLAFGTIFVDAGGEPRHRPASTSNTSPPPRSSSARPCRACASGAAPWRSTWCSTSTLPAAAAEALADGDAGPGRLRRRAQFEFADLRLLVASLEYAAARLAARRRIRPLPGQAVVTPPWAPARQAQRGTLLRHARLPLHRLAGGGRLLLAHFLDADDRDGDTNPMRTGRPPGLPARPGLHACASTSTNTGCSSWRGTTWWARPALNERRHRQHRRVAELARELGPLPGQDHGVVLGGATQWPIWQEHPVAFLALPSAPACWRRRPAASRAGTAATRSSCTPTTRPASSPRSFLRDAFLKRNTAVGPRPRHAPGRPERARRRPARPSRATCSGAAWPRSSATGSSRSSRARTSPRPSWTSEGEVVAFVLKHAGAIGYLPAGADPGARGWSPVK